MSHFGKSGLRSSLFSIPCISTLLREIPFK
jgi:hypothetical protein